MAPLALPLKMLTVFVCLKKKIGDIAMICWMFEVKHYIIHIIGNANEEDWIQEDTNELMLSNHLWCLFALVVLNVPIKLVTLSNHIEILVNNGMIMQNIYTSWKKSIGVCMSIVLDKCQSKKMPFLFEFCWFALE